MSGDWPLVSLSNLTVKVGSGATPRGGEKVYRSSGVPLIRSMNVVFFGFKHEGLVYLDDVNAQALKNVTVKPGDVLLNITGASIGRVTVAPPDLDGARVNQHVCIIRTLPDLDPHFLAAFLSTPSMQARIGAENYGVTRQALTKQQILEFTVPVPAIAEQRRMVVALDRLLSKIRNCRRRLQTIPQTLREFREAVLEAALSGRLTEEWRQDAPFQEHHWQKVPLGQLLEDVRYGTAVKCSYEATSATPVLRIPNVSQGRIDLSDLKYGRLPKQDRVRLSLKEGDLLMVRSNGSVDLVGRVAVVPDGLQDHSFAGYLIRLRLDRQRALPEFLAVALASPAIRKHIELTARSTSGVNNINSEQIRQIQIDIPALPEQAEIARRAQSLLAMAESIQFQVNVADNRAANLTSAVLAKAYQGELMPHYPEEVPASMTPERIKAGQKMAEPSELQRPLGSVHGRRRRKNAAVARKRREARGRKRA